MITDDHNLRLDNPNSHYCDPDNGMCCGYPDLFAVCTRDPKLVQVYHPDNTFAISAYVCSKWIEGWRSTGKWIVQ